MTAVPCGAGVCVAGAEPGTIGCLVRFKDTPNQVLLLTAGHVVLAQTAKQGDRIESPELAGNVLGLLLTWTTLRGDVTADAALIWVDPSLVSPQIISIGIPSPTPVAVTSSQRLRMYSLTGKPREMTVSDTASDVPVLARGPGWSAFLTYKSQIICRPEATEPGDSGAIVVDDSNHVVGMVVAGSEGSGMTVITPISAILTHPAWQGGELEILDAIPADAIAPPIAQQKFLAGSGRVNLSAFSAAQKVMAQKILNAFASAGFGMFQQVAALANAVAESSLNPAEHALSDIEDSVGLFQLNRKGGVGTGYTVVQLQNPDFNIQLVIAAVSNLAVFKVAVSLDAAVDAFVRSFERPLDVAAQVSHRQVIARTLYLT